MSLPFSVEEYYEKVIQLQDKLRQSEEERLKLEMKYTEVIQVMKEEEEHHFKKLRAKYKQFLEEDRLRQQRNDKILDALERIENRSQVWKAKSEKFKDLKKRYRYQTGPQTCLYDREEKEIRPDIRKSTVDNYLKNMTTVPNEVVQSPPQSKYSNLGNVNSIYWKDPKDIEKHDEKIRTEREFCYTPLKSTKNLENSLKQNKPPLLPYEYLELDDQMSHETPLATTLEVHSSLRRLLKDDTPPIENSLDYQSLKREINPVPLISDTKTVLITRGKNDPQPSEISQMYQHTPLEKEIVKAPITTKPVLSNSDTTSVVENNTMHSRITPSVVTTSSKLHALEVEPTHHIQSMDVKEKEELAKSIKEDVDVPPVAIETLGYDENQSNIETSASTTVHEVLKEKDTSHQEGNEKEEQLSTIDSEPPGNMMLQGKEVDDEVQSLRPQVEEPQLVEDRTEMRNDSVIEPLNQNNESPETLHQKENEDVLEQYNGNHKPLQYNENEQVAQQYDENGQPVHYDENIQQYDENGQPIQYYSGSATDAQYYDQTGQYAQYDEHGQLLQYDEQGQLLQQYDENGQPIQDYYNNGLQYDEHGQPIIQYDENGQPIMQYDENGQPIDHYDVNGQYDENGQLIGYSTDDQAFVDYNENSPQQLDENDLQQSQLQVDPQGDDMPQEKKVEDAQPQGGVEPDSPPAVSN